MKTLEKEFSEEVRLKCLLWSDRHCCLCKETCGTNIQIAHIDPNEPGGDNIDNAIPLCLNCHSKIGAYNPGHPMGNNYRTRELKLRRDQVYEEYTRHLVPPIELTVSQCKIAGGNRELPDVGFIVMHHGDSLPVRVRVKANIVADGKDLGSLEGGYDGIVLWNLNPRTAINGHIQIRDEYARAASLAMITTVTIIDQYGREHEQLPMGWMYKRENKSWIPEPCVTLITSPK